LADVANGDANRTILKAANPWVRHRAMKLFDADHELLADVVILIEEAAGG